MAEETQNKQTDYYTRPQGGNGLMNLISGFHMSLVYVVL